MLTYERAAELFSTADKDYGKPLCNNTRLVQRDENYAVRLYATDVVIIRPDGTYSLRTGGWDTVTTTARHRAYGPMVKWACFRGCGDRVRLQGAPRQPEGPFRTRAARMERDEYIARWTLPLTDDLVLDSAGYARPVPA